MEKILRKQRSRTLEISTVEIKYRLRVLLRCLTFELQLRVAVCSFQKSSIAMAHQVLYHLFIHTIAHFKTAGLCLAHFLVAVAAEDAGHVLADVDRSGMSILRGTFHYALPGTELQERETVKTHSSPFMAISCHFNAHNSPRRQPV